MISCARSVCIPGRFVYGTGPTRGICATAAACREHLYGSHRTTWATDHTYHAAHTYTDHADIQIIQIIQTIQIIQIIQCICREASTSWSGNR